MNEIIIRICEAKDEGFFYDIYRDAEALDDSNPIDGGLCTTMKYALEMATEMAREIISKHSV